MEELWKQVIQYVCERRLWFEKSEREAKLFFELLWHLLRKKDGQSMWPNPNGMLEYGRQAARIAKLRYQLAQSDDKTKLAEQIETEMMIFEKLDKECHLPILECRECKEECEPRSAYHLYNTVSQNINRIQ